MNGGGSSSHNQHEVKAALTPMSGRILKEVEKKNKVDAEKEKDITDLPAKENDMDENED